MENIPVETFTQFHTSEKIVLIMYVWPLAVYVLNTNDWIEIYVKYNVMRVRPAVKMSLTIWSNGIYD